MQKLDRLLSSPRPQSATYLGASSTQNSEISTSYPSPTLAFAERCSTLVYIGGITPCIKGRGRRSGSSGLRSGFPAPSSFEKIEATGCTRDKRRRRSSRLVAFRGLWKCVHVEYDPGDENRKSRALFPPSSCSRTTPSPRAAWDYFSDRQPEATGLIIEAGIEAETEKGFSEVCRVIVEISSLFSFFSETFRSSWDFVALASRGLYECSL